MEIRQGLKVNEQSSNINYKYMVHVIINRMKEHKDTQIEPKTELKGITKSRTQVIWFKFSKNEEVISNLVSMYLKQSLVKL